MKEVRNLTIADLLAMEDTAAEEFREALALLLEHRDPTKPAGTRLCDAFMRNWPTPAFEAVAFRENDGKVEVYLRKRADDDTAYPGEWHVPGSLGRHGENNRKVADRLEKEFGCKIESFDCVGDTWNEEGDEVRGTVISFVYIVKLDGEPRTDDRHMWCDVENLPQKTVDSHRDTIIPMAFNAYLGE